MLQPVLRSDLNAFELEYAKIVGRKYAELDKWEARIAAELSNRQTENDNLKQQAQRAKETAKTSSEQQHRSEAKESAPRFVPNEKFKTLYRQAARMMHPDLGTDDADRARRAQAMAKVNDAFARGDEGAEKVGSRKSVRKQIALR